MASFYSIILREDEYSCTVKRVSHSTYTQIRNMLDRGESADKIVHSLTELSTTEDNIAINGVTEQEAIDYACSSGDNSGKDYIILQVF